MSEVDRELMGLGVSGVTAHGYVTMGWGENGKSKRVQCTEHATLVGLGLMNRKFRWGRGEVVGGREVLGVLGVQKAAYPPDRLAEKPQLSARR
jgi:hypothetical protein